MLMNESGYIFIVSRWLDGKAVAAFLTVESAIRSVELSHQAEIRWEPLPGNNNGFDARCKATLNPVASLFKVPVCSIPLALVL